MTILCDNFLFCYNGVPANLKMRDINHCCAWWCRSTKAICWCSNWSAANSAHPRRQRGKGFESEADNERRGEAFQPGLSVWWRLNPLMDTMRKEAHLLLPWHQIPLRPWHLLWQRGMHLIYYFSVISLVNSSSQTLGLTLWGQCLCFCWLFFRFLFWRWTGNLTD